MQNGAVPRGHAERPWGACFPPTGLKCLAPYPNGCRVTVPEEEQLLKQALLTDPEAPPAKKRQRSWVSLLGTSITYVWPENSLLQVS